VSYLPDDAPRPLPGHEPRHLTRIVAYGTIVLVILAAVSVIIAILTLHIIAHPNKSGGSSRSGGNSAIHSHTSGSLTTYGHNGGNPARPETLLEILHPSNDPPVGTGCKPKALLFGLKKETVKSRIDCAATTARSIKLWGYQFFGKPDYLTGLNHVDSYFGFTSGSDRCPPSGVYTSGSIGWDSPPNYRSRPGQFIQCFTYYRRPFLIWTMPTQNVFFMAQDKAPWATIDQVMKWWKTLRYG
jgi:hypothetical protein